MKINSDLNRQNDQATRNIRLCRSNPNPNPGLLKETQNSRLCQGKPNVVVNKKKKNAQTGSLKNSEFYVAKPRNLDFVTRAITPIRNEHK